MKNTETLRRKKNNWEVTVQRAETLQRAEKEAEIKANEVSRYSCLHVKQISTLQLRELFKSYQNPSKAASSTTRQQEAAAAGKKEGKKKTKKKLSTYTWGNWA